MPYRAPPQRAVTPQGRGRFPGFDVLDQVDVLGRRHRRCGAGPAGAAERPGVLHPARGRPSPHRCWTCCSPRTASPGCRCCPDRHPAGDRRDRRLALRRPARGRPGVAATPSAHLDGDAQRSARRRRSPTATATEQAALIQAVQDLAADAQPGTDWPAAHVWSLWTRYACTAFYSHPWAWNEIGFPGPAYPRGYLNPGIDARERGRSPTADDVDPVPFAERGRAGPRASTTGDLRRRAAAREMTTATIRARNESAWLLPNDGSRTNHRLRADMRRFDDDDEVDLVVVGAGAGGGVLDPAAGPGRLAGRRAWTPARSGTPTPTGSATNAARTPCTGPSRARSAAPTRSRWAPTTPAAASAGRWSTTPATRRGSTRPTSAPAPPTASAPTGRSTTPTCKPLLRAARGRTAGRRAGLAVGRPAPLPAPPAPGRRQRRDLPARRGRRRASRPGSARSRSPTAASATGRTASTAASACRAARSTPRPAR